MKFSVLVTLFSAFQAVLSGKITVDEPIPDTEFYNHTIAPRGGEGYHAAAYFANWGVYAGDSTYQPHDLPVERINRVLYAFANVTLDGTVKMTDSFADVTMRYAGDVGESGHNVYGAVKQLFHLKKQNRHLKVLLSIGGWASSSNFRAATSTVANRQRFSTTAAHLMGDWGFDGLDINWEYPTTLSDAHNLELLLEDCRHVLDSYAKRTAAPGTAPYHFLLSIASPAGPNHYGVLNLGGLDRYVDIWHLMAYDYAWDDTTGHAANLFVNPAAPVTTKCSTDQAVRAYEAAGVSPRKMLLGLPLYGRTWLGTSGLGQPFQAVGGVVGQDGQPTGTWPVHMLPRPGQHQQVHFDPVADATYSYDPVSHELVSYDTPAEAARKADYVVRRGLGGAFFWEAGSDAPGERSLIRAASARLGQLDRSPNLLHYPASQYDNIRGGLA